MESLIYDNFKTGCPVEIFMKGSAFPIEAKFVKCSRGGLLAKTESGKKLVVSIADILMIRQAVAPTLKTTANLKERPFTTGKTFTPSVPHNEEAEDNAGNANLTPEPAPVARQVLPASPESEPETAKPETDLEPESSDSVSTLFKLPSEKPQLKILGSIQLDDSDKNKKRFKDTVVSFETPKLADDFLETEMPAMGTLKSVGPVYGYIKLPDGNDLYSNRGEFIFLPGEDTQLEIGMPLAFSIGTNWKGNMAKCVHRPYTVGEQLELIEKVINTDVRNARLLAKQLTDAFPDSEEIADALEAYPQL